MVTMLRALPKALMPSSKDSLAKAFSRLGWIGFWIQVVIGSIPVPLVTYALIFGRSGGAGTRGGFLLVEFLTIAGYWCSPRYGFTDTPALASRSTILHGVRRSLRCSGWHGYE